MLDAKKIDAAVSAVEAFKSRVDRYADANWEESKHKRGQPENKGQFGSGGGGAPTKETTHNKETKQGSDGSKHVTETKQTTEPQKEEKGDPAAEGEAKAQSGEAKAAVNALKAKQEKDQEKKNYGNPGNKVVPTRHEASDERDAAVESFFPKSEKDRAENLRGDLNKFQKEEGNPELSKDETLALSAYVGSSYGVINSPLRKGFDKWENGSRLEYKANPNSAKEKKLSAVASALDDALGKLSENDKPSLRVMSIPWKKELGEFLGKYKEGSEVTEDSYTSSSTTTDYSNKQGLFQGKPNIRIKFSSGGKQVPSPLMQFQKEEGEVIFPRGSKFRVKKMNSNNDTHEIELEYLSSNRSDSMKPDPNMSAEKMDKMVSTTEKLVKRMDAYDARNRSDDYGHPIASGFRTQEQERRSDDTVTQEEKNIHHTITKHQQDEKEDDEEEDAEGGDQPRKDKKKK